MGLKSKQISNDDVDSWNKTLLDISSTSTENHQEQQQPAEALDCPRCGSRNTKFCYYNNYNRSQPRHFCKACKRYWTNGGTLRNVPIGGAGRKNKRLKTLLNSAKTTTVPIPDRQDYCINLHLPPQEGLKAVSDNQKNISEFLFEALSVDSTSPQDGSQNLSFSGGLESFHLNGNPSPIPGIYDCSSQLESIASSSITENYSSIFCQQLQGLNASGQELINCWSLNDLDTLISADDLNYVPWDDAEEINK